MSTSTVLNPATGLRALLNFSNSTCARASARADACVPRVLIIRRFVKHRSSFGIVASGCSPSRQHVFCNSVVSQNTRCLTSCCRDEEQPRATSVKKRRIMRTGGSYFAPSTPLPFSRAHVFTCVQVQMRALGTQHVIYCNMLVIVHVL